MIVNHVVALTGPDTATGMMYLLDFVTGDMMRDGGNPLYWLGVYDEDYRKVDGRVEDRSSEPELSLARAHAQRRFRRAAR